MIGEMWVMGGKNNYIKLALASFYFFAKKFMKIGFFDSGLGGLDTLFEFRKILPEYDYIYFADNKNNPYGQKSAKIVKNLTYKGINFLFSQGVNIVILACNTAASASIKSWQKDFPNKKVLSVTIPVVEEIVEKNYKNILIVCTNATSNSKVFETKYYELKGKNKIRVLATPTLVPFIEHNQIQNLEKDIENIFSKKNLERQNFDALVLGCTHYPIVQNIFQNKIHTNIINPAKIAAQKFEIYLKKHKDIEKKLDQNKKLEIFYSGVDNFDIVFQKWNQFFETKKVQLD